MKRPGYFATLGILAFGFLGTLVYCAFLLRFAFLIGVAVWFGAVLCRGPALGYVVKWRDERPRARRAFELD